ncbi:hypothetical protein SC660_08855 [Actinotignum timonense]|nr:hypothetical protein [Actinotignum timonense]MDY5135609.1 hypothetical protein [Actinotignum timonense]
MRTTLRFRGGAKRAFSAALAGLLATTALAVPASVLAAETGGSEAAPDPNATMQPYEKGKSDDYYHGLLQALPETVKNNDLADKALNDAVAALNLEPGAVKEVTELGGWKAINSGKFVVAKAREDGLYINSMAGTAVVESDNNKVQYFIDEQATGKHPYLLALGQGYDSQGFYTGAQKIDGSEFVQPFYGIERNFKAYSPENGSRVVVDFSTGSLAQTTRPAGYTVRVLATQDGTEKEFYKASFNPSTGETTDEYTVTGIGGGSGQPIFDKTPATETEIANGTSIPYIQYSTTQSAMQHATQFTNKTPVDLTSVKSGAVGHFTSKPIDLPAGITDYKVQITPDFASTSGVFENWHHPETLRLQRSVKHYVTPIFEAFYVDQKTDPAAKQLLREQLEALKKIKETTVVDKSDPSIAKLDEAIAAAEAAVSSEEIKTAADYKKLSEELKTAKDELIDIAPALAQIKAELEKKTAEIDQAPGAQPADKEAAKKAAQEAANAAIAALKAVADKSEIDPALQNGLEAIRAVTVSDKDALIAKVNEDPTFKATPEYQNTNDQVFRNEDGTPDTAKNTQAAAAKQAYDQALAEAQKVIANPTATQDEVDAALDALNTARTEVEKYTTTKVPLKKSLDENGVVEKTDPIYANATPEEQQAYDTAVQAARDLFAKGDATQAEANAAQDALEAAKAALDKRATVKDKLQASVGQDDATKGSPAYTNASDENAPEAVKEAKKNYDAAVEAARKVLDDPKATQAQVDEATKALDDARAKLTEAGKTVKDKLEASIGKDEATKATPAYTNASDENAPEAMKEAKKNYDAAVEAARKVFEDPNATQTQVDEATKSLDDARAKLEDTAKTVKDKLEASINQDEATKAGPAYNNASGDNASDEAKEAKKNYDAAVEAARKVFEDPNATQAQVDEATKNLDDARAKLTETAKTVKDKLEESIGKDEATKADPAYTNASDPNASDEAKDAKKNYDTALDNARKVFEDPNATQAQVDEATKNLDDARAKLTETAKTVKDKLEASIGKDEATKADPAYTNASDENAPEAVKETKKNYDEALEAARKVFEDPNATQAQVDEATKNLDDARAKLTETAKTDKDKLEASINQDEATKAGPAYNNASGDNASDEAKEAKKNYDAAVEAARKVFEDPNATQAAVDEATKNLDDARAKLTETAKTDKDKLEASIGQDDATKAGPAYNNASGDNASDEAKEAKKNYDEALEAARKVLEDPNATQAQVDEATKNLDDARAKLTEAAKTAKDKLEASIGQDESTKADPKYSAASEDLRKSYDDALANAKRVLADANATQAQVDEATAALDNARAEISGVKLPEKPEQPQAEEPQPDQPSEPGKVVKKVKKKALQHTGTEVAMSTFVALAAVSAGAALVSVRRRKA